MTCKTRSRRCDKNDKSQARSGKSSSPNKSRSLSYDYANHRSKIDSSNLPKRTVYKVNELMNLLQSLNLVTKKWSISLNSEKLRTICKHIKRIFKPEDNIKDSRKMKIIHEICSHQIQFQEETLSGLVNKNATDLQSSKELIAKDAMIIINEIPDVDLDVSNNSIEEIQFQEKYNDPQFQELLNTLKKL